MPDYDPQKTGLDPDLVCAATHEAGHTIATVLGGGEVNAIKIYPAGETFGGHVDAEFDPETQLDELLVFLVAGHEAEALWRTHYLDRHRRAALRESRRGCRDDMATFHRYRRRGGTTTLTEPAARGRAHSLLIAHWDRVERLADRLARVRHLTTAG
ncbi:hypothetical protein AB0L88_01400 [Saccharopolyspora shandongensis]|uniref:hypothetical protein n=1 Tax=Saccharopolyspora shandongensis TaxID=418495 RepID=UPI0034280759